MRFSNYAFSCTMSTMPLGPLFDAENNFRQWVTFAIFAMLFCTKGRTAESDLLNATSVSPVEHICATALKTPFRTAQNHAKYL
jgi:hypothetical protein